MKEVKGCFCQLNGKKYYKIENYDHMENFFMTITSSSDIWNFCWSQGGITAGRIDSNHAIFPYYTADKVSDAAPYTGNFTSIAVKINDEIEIWEPFTAMHAVPSVKKAADKYLIRNIYKSFNGTEVLFEEINTQLNLKFITGWTSSEKYGLVRKTYIENLSSEKVELSILDGCQNILPACIDSTLQNNNSMLLDAYKKTDLDTDNNLAIFALSSVLSDKAEPNEGLYGNTCWFSTTDKVILAVDAPQQFIDLEKLPVYEDFNTENVSKGERSVCYICKKITLAPAETQNWYQVFNTSLNATQIAALCADIKDRKTAVAALEKDIEAGEALMTEFIKAADGIQDTADEVTCLHHQQNVMFNIMRGGIFANKGKIEIADFIAFTKQRNVQVSKKAEEYLKNYKKEALVDYPELLDTVEKTNDPQFARLFLEYMPLTFSRRHGDPSRPWNIFSIKLKTPEGKPILNYEGNWRDIFQNWEALAYSYPSYIKNMCAKFLNAMTPEGFNPYKINRAGIDWEVPNPNDPWAHIGYWGDHQVIYFEKLLEFYDKTNRAKLLSSVNEQLYVSANVPYRINSYEKIVENPRSTIVFDKELSNKLFANTKEKGSDEKLVLDADGNPYLVTFAAKVLQIVLTKAANFVPAGGIWLNTQRPEWNDANNALAGYGLSVVTLCYLYRYIQKLVDIFANTSEKEIVLPKVEADLLEGLLKLYSSADVKAAATDSKKRKAFVDEAGKLFEAERNALYSNGYSDGEVKVSSETIVKTLQEINKHFEYSIRANKREDGLYHSYNTLKITNNEMIVEYLQEMLEGQVAVISSNLLTPEEAKSVVVALQNSKIYEPRQKSFMLYPNKTLKEFQTKNCISESEVKDLAGLISRTGNKYLEKDCTGTYHFNPDFRNSNLIKEFIAAQEDKPTAAEQTALFDLYEKTFNHQAFTGRSGTFYAYEGLGSIYWHMVSKLLLAVQENIIKAYEENNAKLTIDLTNLYYDVRSGLGFNKTPDLYGAFPADPYSHTPLNKGAKQPGMTGQVKEEVLTRWGELGIFINSGVVSFNPIILKKSEIKADGTINFTWCGIPVTYKFTNQNECYITVNGVKTKGTALTESQSQEIFNHEDKVSSIEVEFSSGFGF